MTDWSSGDTPPPTPYSIARTLTRRHVAVPTGKIKVPFLTETATND